MNRRKFISTASLLSLGALAAPHLAGTTLSSSTKKLIGIQLWTLRDALHDDLSGSLKKLAKIGYNTLEAAGYRNKKFYDKAPEEFKKLADDLGMQLIASHSTINDNNVEQTYSDALKAGIKYVVVPWLPESRRKSLDNYKETAENLNRFGEKANEMGLKLGYHNHGFEFTKIDGELPYDILLKQTEPEHVVFEMDIQWVMYGKQDPVNYINTHPGRFALWHVKDMNKNNRKLSEIIGKGSIDFTGIYKLAGKAGLQYQFVEHAVSDDKPFEDVAFSYNYIKNNLIDIL